MDNTFTPDPDCEVCTVPYLLMDESRRMEWCIPHQEMFSAWRHDMGPLRPRSNPRCPTCSHHPRLLRRMQNKDAWECRWGHEVSGVFIHYLRRAGVSLRRGHPVSEWVRP